MTREILYDVFHNGKNISKSVFLHKGKQYEEGRKDEIL